MWKKKELARVNSRIWFVYPYSSSLDCRDFGLPGSGAPELASERISILADLTEPRVRLVR